MEGDGDEAAPASSTAGPTSTVVRVTASPGAPLRPDTPIRAQSDPTTSANPPSDRQAVQVIQQVMHRPAGVTEQYLQQMYSAQQQHIMLHTAALHQQQQATSTTQGPASQQQGSQSNSKQTTSPPPFSKGSATQTVIPLSSSPVTTQSIAQLQVTSASGAISQQAMLLGNVSPPGSQAQMYLRTQMLILAPAATMAADLPTMSSVTSQPVSTEVPSLALRTHLPGALTAAQCVQLKATSQGQTIVPPLPKMSICPLKTTQLSQALAETSRTFSPSQTHAVVQHQLHCAPSQKGAPPQFILQSSTTQRQMQPIALRVTAQDSAPPPLSLLTRTTSTPATVLSQHCEVLSVPASSNQPPNQSTVQQQAVVVSTSTLPPSCTTLPDPPPLHLGPVVEPLSQQQTLSCPPPLTLALPRLAAPLPSTLQRLSLRSVHALAVQSDHMLVSEDELPVAEALVQLPFQSLPPPQTVAVDLKVQPTAQTEAPSAAQQLKDEGSSMDVAKEKPVCPQQNRTPTTPTDSHAEEPQSIYTRSHTAQSDHCTGPLEHFCLQSSRSVIRSPEECAPTVNTVPTTTTSPTPFHCAAVRSSSRLPPASLPASPESRPSQATVRPHILTHLIEGFVIREGLEPFPVNRTSLESQQQTKLPEDQELPANGEPAHQSFLLDGEEPENSSESDMDNPPAEDERPEESLTDLLQCEFCGKKGYVHTFLRSKRFCSMTCVRRFNVSCTKRLSVLRAHRVGHWPNRPMGRRGRPPSRVHCSSREDFFRRFQAYRPNDGHQASNSPSQDKGEEREEDEEEEGEEEEDVPSPVMTRLRLQVEREKVQVQRGREDCSSSTCLFESSPSQWSVEQVCSYIRSLPGCQDVALEFRTQEIDGQALLLLTEEHLMSAMNIKLGPALKICAHINTLKEP